MGLGSAYLALYNGAQTIGWGFVLFQLVSFVAPLFAALIEAEGLAGAFSATIGGALDLRGLWATMGFGLFVFQNLAALEVVHSVVGLVRSPVFTTFVQVLSRLLLVNVAHYFVSVQSNVAVVIMVAAWSITEVVRYFFFTLKEFGVPTPFALTWLRYSMFFVLYPVGVLGELLTFWAAKPEFEKRQSTWSVNVSGFDLHVMHAFYVVLAAYLPGLPVMYLHMISQRKRTLYPRPAVAGSGKNNTSSRKKRN